MERNVNTVCYINSNTICSGSDDGTLRFWDVRAQEETSPKIELKSVRGTSIPILSAVTLSDPTTLVFSGCVNNTIYCHDVRNTAKEVYSLSGHRGK